MDVGEYVVSSVVQAVAVVTGVTGHEKELLCVSFFSSLQPSFWNQVGTSRFSEDGGLFCGFDFRLSLIAARRGNT
jgi:hypothetical protein